LEQAGAGILSDFHSSAHADADDCVELHSLSKLSGDTLIELSMLSSMVPISITEKQIYLVHAVYCFLENQSAIDELNGMGVGIRTEGAGPPHPSSLRPANGTLNTSSGGNDGGDHKQADDDERPLDENAENERPLDDNERPPSDDPVQETVVDTAPSAKPSFFAPDQNYEEKHYALSLSLLPINAQIGVKLFFRLLRSVHNSKDVRSLGKLVRQLPMLLQEMPALALESMLAPNAKQKKGIDTTVPKGGDDGAGAGAAPAKAKPTPTKKGHPEGSGELFVAPAATHNVGVVDALWELLENVVSPEGGGGAAQLQRAKDSKDSAGIQLDNAGYSAALTGMVGLAIKRGSLEHILQVIKFLLCNGAKSPLLSTRSTLDNERAMSSSNDLSEDLLLAEDDFALGDDDDYSPLHLAPFLKELEEAQPEIPEIFLQKRRRCGQLMTFGKGDHGKLGHGKCKHTNTQCTDGNCTENKFKPTFVEQLSDMAVAKIDNLSTHSAAVSSSGMLLTWGNGDKYVPPLPSTFHLLTFLPSSCFLQLSPFRSFVRSFSSFLPSFHHLPSVLHLPSFLPPCLQGTASGMAPRPKNTPPK
jgi:hypothetical protein